MVEKKIEPEVDLSMFYKESGCTVSKVHLENPEHQAVLEQALATRTISSSAISDILFEKWGVSVSHDTVAKHRSTPQKCACRNIPK